MSEQFLRKGSRLVPNETASNPADTGKLDGLAQICGLFLPAPVPSGQEKDERQRNMYRQEDGGNAKKAKTSHEFGSPVSKVEKQFNFGDASSTNYTSHYDKRMPSHQMVYSVFHQPLQHPQMVMKENVNDLESPSDVPSLGSSNSKNRHSTNHSSGPTFSSVMKIDQQAQLNHSREYCPPFPRAPYQSIGNEMEMGPNMRRPYRTATRSGSNSAATLSLSSFDGTNKIAKVTPDIKVAPSCRDEKLKRKWDHSTKKAPVKLFPMQTRHSSFSPSRNAFTTVTQDDIRSDDVLFGDRETGLRHAGTLYFRNLIIKARSTYAACDNDFEKKRSMISTIVETLSRRARFIRRIGQGPYFLMTEEDVKEVVNEALRDRRSAPPTCSAELPVLTMPPKIMNNANEGVSGASHGRMRICTRRKLPLCQPRTAFSPSDTFRIPVKKEEITNNDILCGREFRETSHPGNHLYLQTVNDNKARHHELGCQHGEKTKIRNGIVEELVDRGGRFVKKEGDRYYLLTLDEAHSKVGQSLRDNKNRKKARNQNDQFESS